MFSQLKKCGHQPIEEMQEFSSWKDNTGKDSGTPKCDEWEYNTAGCCYDGGDCVESNMNETGEYFDEPPSWKLCVAWQR